MENFDSISNLNFYTAFKSFISGGVESWMNYELKDPEEWDWRDENGKEVDLSERFFKSRALKLDIVMEADTDTEFWTNYKLILQTVSSSGLKRVYLHQLSRSFYVYFNKLSNFSGIGLKEGRICSTFSLEFTEPEPSLFQQFTYLTDKDGNYLTTTNGNKIIL